MAFVGRARFVARLLATIEEAAAGHARLMLVSGVAGIGKTTLIATATARCGLPVGWGTCADAERAPAFWPWTTALRTALAELGPAEVEELVGPDEAELARLLPELGQGPPPGPDPPDTEAARVRLLDALARFLERLARRRPLVLVLDDLQWADPSSLRLLGYVAQAYRPVPLALVVAYRHDELCPDAAATLAEAGGRGEIVELRGLTAPEVRELVTVTSGEPTAERWAGEIHRRTDGHPFLARQLADLLADPDARPDEVPPAVSDLVLRRVARLSPAARRLADAAALAGTSVWPGLLGDACGADTAGVAALVDEVTRAGVFVRVGEDHRVAHDLVRETLRDALAGPDRIALHQALADALERRHGRGVAVVPADLARHSAAAVSLDGPARAVRWARAAAGAERGRLAFDEAAAHLGRARHAIERDASDAGGILVDLLVEEADARGRGGAPDRARELLEDARDRAVTLGDASRLAGVALGVQRLGSRFAMPRDDVVGVLDGALVALDGTGTALEAQVLAALARELHHSVPEHRPRARPLSERALALARGQDDPATLATCLLARHDVLWTPGRAGERIAVSREIAQLAARSGDAERHAEGLLLTANALLETGSPVFRTALAEYLRTIDGSGQPRHRYNALVRRGAARLLDGDLEDAAGLVEAARALGESIGEPDTGNVAMSQLVGLARVRREPGELRATAARAVDHWVGVPSHAHAVAAGLLALAGEPDDLAGARRALDTVLALDGWREDRSYLWPVFVGAMATAAARLGDEAVCADLLAEIEPVAGECGVNGALVCFMGSNAHWAGVVAGALGRADDARRWLERALEVHRRLGARAWVTETVRELARLPGDAPDAELRRDGELWRVRHHGATVHLRDLKGLADLATLLARPGREVHVLELAGAMHRDDDTGAALDATARAAYRRRAAEIDRTLATEPDPVRAGRLERERATVVAELSRSAGLAGRPRPLGSGTVERARKAVSARVRDAIARIGAVSPGLGAHLDRSIITGTWCRYDPVDPLNWRL